MSEVYIDDFNPSVAYSGAWQSDTNDIGTSLKVYNNTEHFTNSTEAKATLTFTGINVMVYGVVGGSTTSKSSYSLDGGTPTTYRWNSSSEPGTEPLLSQQALFYTSPILPNGQHTLTIAPLDDPTTVWFFLDYFIIVTAGNASSSSVTSSTFTTISSTSVSPSKNSASSSTPALVTLTSPTTSGFGDAPPQTTSQLRGDVTTHKNSAIVGTVAGLSIVALFILTCLWLRRRRKQKTKAWTSDTFPGGDEVPAPSYVFPASLPPVSLQMDERPPFPPSYAMSEPPEYVSDIVPAVQVNEYKPLRHLQALSEDFRLNDHNSIGHS